MILLMNHISHMWGQKIGAIFNLALAMFICINLRYQLRMINSKRARWAERSGCRSESEMLSFVASLRAVYITRQIQIYHFLIYTDFITSFIPCKKPITAVPTNLLYLLSVKIHRKSELNVLENTAIRLLFLKNIDLFYEATKKCLLFSICELII